MKMHFNLEFEKLISPNFYEQCTNVLYIPSILTFDRLVTISLEKLKG